MLLAAHITKMERRRAFGFLPEGIRISEERRRLAIAHIHRSFRAPCEVNSTTRRAYSQVRGITEDEARREVLG